MNNKRVRQRGLIVPTDNIPIDLSDIPEITDFSKAKKNPFADKIKKHGYSIVIHYSPEDVAANTKANIERIQSMDLTALDQDERKAFEKYLEANKEYIMG